MASARKSADPCRVSTVSTDFIFTKFVLTVQENEHQYRFFFKKFVLTVQENEHRYSKKNFGNSMRLLVS
jgi:hypothetical protein